MSSNLSEQARTNIRAAALRARPTHCQRGHDLSLEHAVISHMSGGRIKRCCRVCANAAACASYARRKAKAATQAQGQAPISQPSTET